MVKIEHMKDTLKAKALSALVCVMAELDTVSGLEACAAAGFHKPGISRNFPSSLMLPRAPRHLPDYRHLHVALQYRGIKQNIRHESAWLRTLTLS